MTGLCAATVGGLLLLVQGDLFQLSWTHSVEKTEWREDWRVDGGVLVLDRASVPGSGAGMEPPPEAVFADGRWRWSPNSRHREIRLALSGFTRDWSLCAQGSCRPLREAVGNGDQAVLSSCAAMP